MWAKIGQQFWSSICQKFAQKFWSKTWCNILDQNWLTFWSAIGAKICQILIPKHCSKKRVQQFQS